MTCGDRGDAEQAVGGSAGRRGQRSWEVAGGQSCVGGKSRPRLAGQGVEAMEQTTGGGEGKRSWQILWPERASGLVVRVRPGT